MKCVFNLNGNIHKRHSKTATSLPYCSGWRLRRWTRFWRNSAFVAFIRSEFISSVGFQLCHKFSRSWPLPSPPYNRAFAARTWLYRLLSFIYLFLYFYVLIYLFFNFLYSAITLQPGFCCPNFTIQAVQGPTEAYTTYTNYRKPGLRGVRRALKL